MKKYKALFIGFLFSFSALISAQTQIDTDSIEDAAVTETKLNASVNASLDLADSAVQPADNISVLTNDSGYLTAETDDQTAVEVPTTTTAFDNHLSAADTDLQKALETLDELAAGHSDGTNCAPGFYPLGVDAVGSTQSCTPDDTGVDEATTVSDTAEIDLTETGDDISGVLIAGSIDETKLDASTNTSLDLADSALQSVAHSATTGQTASDHHAKAVSGDIDHDATLNFLAAEHFIQGAISITKSQVSDFVESDYATGVEGDLATTALQSIAADSVGTAELDDGVDTPLVGEFVQVATGGLEFAYRTDAEVLTDLGVEAGATADQTGAEIKSAYEAEANTNAFTDANVTTLGNQSGTNTGDQSLAGLVDTAGTPIILDFARFTDADTIEGRSPAEARADLDLEVGVDFDALGTDNSTDVTLAGSGTYVSLAGQVLTIDPITESDISDLTHTTDTDTQLSQEQVEDYAGALVADGTGARTGISVTYQDATGDVDIAIDHDAANNFDAAEHFTQGAISITESQISDLSHTTDTDTFVTGKDAHDHLGGDGATILHSSLGSIGASDHHTATVDTDTQLTEEQVEDFAGSLTNGVGDSRITVTYNDAQNRMDYVVDDMNDTECSTTSCDLNAATTIGGAAISTGAHTTDTDTQLTQEQVEDFAGALVANATGTHTGIAVTYQDATGDMDLVVDHDAASNFLSTEHFTQAAISITESQISDLTHTTDTDTQLSQEEVEDFAGGMDLGTETRLSFTYNDTTGNFDIVVDDMNQTSGDIDHDATINFLAAEHVDWTGASAGTIHATNYVDNDTTYAVGDGGLTTNDFTAADHTKLDGIETAADVTDTANVTSAGALMDSEVDADIKTLSLPPNTTISTFGESLIDDLTAITGRATLGVDPAGTDNSTDVTLAGTGTYVSLAGQVLTADPITESDISDLAHTTDTDTFVTNKDSHDHAGGDGSQIPTAGIVDHAVTPAKIIQIAANTIIGNNTGSPADMASLTPAQVLTMIEAVPLAGGTMTGELVIDDLGIEATATDAITDCTSFSATSGGLFYDDSEGKWKKCEDNVLSDLSAGGGASQLTDLSDVNTSTPTDGFMLVADGVDFKSRALVVADISDAPFSPTNVGVSAYLTTNEAVAATVLEQLAGFTEEYDLGGDFNSTTGVFTAPSAGKYSVSMQATFQVAAAADLILSQFLVESVVASESRKKGHDGAWESSGAHTKVVDLAAGDEVTFEVLNNTSADTVLAGKQYTYVTITPVSGILTIAEVDVADLANGTDGELITWDATGAPATVAPGTSGHVLTSNGAGAAPTFQAGGGGSSYWTEVELGADFEWTTTSTVASGLKFTPSAANTQYEFEATLLVLGSNSTAAYCYTQPTWPTGLDWGTVRIAWQETHTSEYDRPERSFYDTGSDTYWAVEADCASTTHPNIVTVQGFIQTGGTPSGDFEFSGKTLSTSSSYHWKMLAGSVIRYRAL